MGGAILSFLGRPFFLFSTTSPPSISSSGFLLLNARFLLMVPILSSLSLLVSSLFFTSFRAETPSFGLTDKRRDTVGSLATLVSFALPFSHLSRGTSPAVEQMAVVTPGVAFDLSVNLESKAFIGSILEAEVSSRLDFTL